MWDMKRLFDIRYEGVVNNKTTDHILTIEVDTDSKVLAISAQAWLERSHGLYEWTPIGQVNYIKLSSVAAYTEAFAKLQKYLAWL